MGIDYGRGSVNIDKETGIRFGVINQNELMQAWSDSSEANYPDPCCPQCGGEIVDYDDEKTLQILVKKFAEAKAEQGFTCDIYYFPKPKKAAK